MLRAGLVRGGEVRVGGVRVWLASLSTRPASSSNGGAAAAPSTTKLAHATPSSSSSHERKNPLSLVFEDMIYRGRGDNLLSLGDLRKLLQQCQGKDDVRYGVQMVEFYQRKGQDFSEEVASHFVSMSIRGEQPMVAVKALAKYKNRIGAWVTPKSFHNLVTSVLSMEPPQKAEGEGEVKGEGEAEGPLRLLASALETVSKKGVKLGAEDVQELARRLSEAGDLEAYIKVMAAVPRVIDAEAVERIAKLHPPPAVAVAADADAGAGATPADAPAATTDESPQPPAV